MEQHEQGEQKIYSAACLVEHPVDDDLLACVGENRFTEERLDLLVVESLDVCTTQEGVVGSDSACAGP